MAEQGISGTNVAVSGLILTLGGVLVFSALTGTSIVDVIAGKKTDTLDAQGGSKVGLGAGGAAGAALGPAVAQDAGAQAQALTGTASGNVSGNVPQPLSFKGPRAALLMSMADAAMHQFGLTITATTNGGHVPGSYHYSGRAFDASGSEANMRAFASYIIQTHLKDTAELIHNPGQCIKDGRLVNGAQVYSAVWVGHRDHVHFAA